MNALSRWVRFNFVGAVGMAVQLGTLTLLNRCFPARYLITSAAALELTLIHNFAWHLNVTWRDRGGAASWPVQLLRFHLSNGLCSFAGSLLLLPALIQFAKLPLLAANLVVIAICSGANFWLGDRWVFERRLGQPQFGKAS